ncbi:hypothetical protein AB4Y45_32215 [Paraburkholderia sp. EG287A]|uniref:hypothetical protein n=1 Tax=Paraburkholderia sp. EG287A TaxID=3237012 RepID=UPI0034D22C01
MKARDLVICVFAAPALFLLFKVLDGVFAAVSATIHFFASFQTNVASLNFISFVLMVLSAFCAVTVFRKLHENFPWAIRSWAEFREVHRENVGWYGLSLIGAALTALQFYMLWLSTVSQTDGSFGEFVFIFGFMAGLVCAASFPGNLLLTLWHVWRDRPVKAVAR